MAQTDIRVLVPRVRRRVEGVGVPAVLTDDAIKDLAADALSSIALYMGSAFGSQIIVTGRDANGAPDEYATTDELTPEESTVVAAQAALDYYWRALTEIKTSEKIGDEAGSWEWQRSASLLKSAFDALISERDKALWAALANEQAPDEYISYLATRDPRTCLAVEPWTDPAQVAEGYATTYYGGGQGDIRFGTAW